MIKVFISMPMHGRTDDEVQKEADKWFEWFKEHHHIIASDCILASPCSESFGPLDFEPRKPRVGYLGRSLSVLADCNFCVMAPGWSKARGCQIELATCLAYNIPVIMTNAPDQPKSDWILWDRIRLAYTADF